MALTPAVKATEIEVGVVQIPNNTYSSTPKTELKKQGKLVTFTFMAPLNGTLPGTNGLVCTLPEGFRPSVVKYIYFYGTYGTTTNFFTFILNTDGTIKSGTGGSSFSGTLSTQTSFFLE